MSVYTCDGCGASSTVRPEEKPVGFRTVTLTGREHWLCTICYRAVEWVVWFQRLTHPPRVYRADGKYSLRSKQ